MASRRPTPPPAAVGGFEVPTLIRGRLCSELWADRVKDADATTRWARIYGLARDLRDSWLSNSLDLNPRWHRSVRAALGGDRLGGDGAPWSIATVDADYLDRLGLPADWHPSREAVPDPIPPVRPEHRGFTADPLAPQ